MNFYNEKDAFAAAWLRELINAGLIAPGVVDERSIEEIKPSELDGYTQCHFFAGIGVWSYALRLAGWPDDRAVWTGSCPCQPFSTAGERTGTGDERHLWPVWFRLIRERKPHTVFGEQVENAVRFGWLDALQTDLEGIGYAVGKIAFPAASVGAPHRRQRLYIVADSANVRCNEQRKTATTSIQGKCTERTREQARPEQSRKLSRRPKGLRGSSGMADAKPNGSNATNYWTDCDRVYCKDGKHRPIEPGSFPLVDGTTNSMGRLRGYGNAIVAPQAAMFIKAFLESQVKR